MTPMKLALFTAGCSLAVAAIYPAELTAGKLQSDDGYRGIWYYNQPTKDEYKYKYSGGMATYPQQHIPFAIYSPQANKTFFCYGGTTARVFGKKAPLIVTNAMLDGMKPGSIVVDLAIETGGNVEAAEVGKEIERNGVTIIGLPELQRRVPRPASRMFSSNLYNFVEHFWDKEQKQFVLNRDDEIIKGCLITHEGQIINSTVQQAIG